MTKRADYDSPWKTIIERHFEECLAFYFPDLHAAIDWSVEPIFLDQELQQITGDSEVGKRRVDRLVDVRLKTGENVWLLIHIEVQRQPEDNFAERMFIYHYRIFERFHRAPVSLAILTDRKKEWHPTQYTHGAFGCKLQLDFPAVKLLNYDEAALLQSTNPFALVTLAQLAESKAGKATGKRYDTKLRLMRLLFAHGYDKSAIRNLLTFIDWILRLPKGLEEQLKFELIDSTSEEKMEYVSYFEQSLLDQGREEGREEERLSMTLTLLKLRFERVPDDAMMAAIEEMNTAQLHELFLFVAQADDWENVEAYLDG